jgi:hypothetical protein
MIKELAEGRLFRPCRHAMLRRLQFVRDEFREPTQISMHPAVWADLLMTLEGPERYYIDWRADGPYLMDMKVIPDHECPGIDMLLA